MDNVKYYNDSLAYDFEMFMPKTEKKTPQDNIVKMPHTVSKSRVRATQKRISLSAFAVFVSVVMLAALCGNIYMNLRINEVNDSINTVKSEIAELESERTALQVEYERRISFANIEVEAAELGMQKMDKSQVKYIRVNDKNTAVTKDGKTVSGTK